MATRKKLTEETEEKEKVVKPKGTTRTTKVSKPNARVKAKMAATKEAVSKRKAASKVDPKAKAKESLGRVKKVVEKKSRVKKEKAAVVEENKPLDTVITEVEEAEPEKELFAYKAVKRIWVDDEYDEYRLISPSITGKLVLQYREGATTRAPYPLLQKGYGILIFLSPITALSWGSSYEVWKVRCGKISECPTRRIRQSFGASINHGIVEGDWDKIAEWLMGHVVVRAWPHGSKMSEWVELVEKVSYHDRSNWVDYSQTEEVLPSVERIETIEQIVQTQQIEQVG